MYVEGQDIKITWKTENSGNQFDQPGELFKHISQEYYSIYKTGFLEKCSSKCSIYFRGWIFYSLFLLAIFDIPTFNNPIPSRVNLSRLCRPIENLSEPQRIRTESELEYYANFSFKYSYFYRKYSQSTYKYSYSNPIVAIHKASFKLNISLSPRFLYQGLFSSRMDQNSCCSLYKGNMTRNSLLSLWKELSTP